MRTVVQTFLCVGMAAPAPAIVLAGCGSSTSPVCVPSGAAYSVTPASSVKDHAAFSPGNQQQFVATRRAASAPGCASPQVVQRLTPNWTVSDSQHVQISSAQDDTNGLAVCLGPTPGPATITALIENGSAVTPLTATLFCE